MRQAEYFLAIDQGGHASRAMIFDQQAKIISQAECAIETFTPKPNWVEHDAEALVMATQNAIAAAVSRLGNDAHLLQTAGLATQRSSLVCWHKQSGAALSPVLSWQDRRQAGWLQRFNDQNAFVHARTGLFLSPHYGASKMRWCLENIDDVKQALADGTLVIGPLASFLAFRLLHERPLFADPANASRTLLWNMASGDWDEALLSLFGIPRSILPSCCDSRHAFGHLRVAGLNLPMQVITGDQSAALFAWGQPDAKTAYVNIGTGAFVQRPLAKQTEHARLLSSVAYQDQNYRCYTLEGTVNGAARALQWFAASEAIENIEQRVIAALASQQIPPLFINSVSGLAAPDWHANLEPRFIGDGDLNARLLAVIESIAFLIQRNLETMAQRLPPPERIVVSGGLASLDGLCQMLAHLSNTPVIRAEALEATATGLAYLCAARPAGWPALIAARTFLPGNAAALLQRYRQWSAALHHLLTDSA